MRRKLLRAIAPALLLSFGGAYALASWNWCGRWEPAPAAIEAAGLAQGALLAGAARVKVAVPWPVVPAGYGPPRPELRESKPSLEARAVVLEVAPVKVAIVELDLLTIPRALVERVRADAAALRLSDVWVVATHAHSSMGGYDARWVSELAGTGRYREEIFEALAQAAKQALADADAGLGPSVLAVGEGQARELSRPRTGAQVDGKLTRVSLSREGKPLAELWIVSAHPALVGRNPQVLSPDYPGVVDADAGPVRLVLQGAAGNASAQVPEGEGSPGERFARALEEKALGLSATPSGAEVTLGFSRVAVGTPRPDASRLAPWFARAAGDNLLCGSAPRLAEVGALRLGGAVLLGVPGEPSATAGAALVERSGASRVVSLANGYLGYVEPAETVKQRGGESKRQYFGPQLLERLEEAAALAGRAVRQRMASP